MVNISNHKALNSKYILLNNKMGNNCIQAIVLSLL